MERPQSKLFAEAWDKRDVRAAAFKQVIEEKFAEVDRKWVELFKSFHESCDRFDLIRARLKLLSLLRRINRA